MVFGDPEFAPTIINDEDVDEWMRSRNPGWTDGSTAMFGFEYGNLTGEYFVDGAVMVAFHENDCPYTDKFGTEIQLNDEMLERIGVNRDGSIPNKEVGIAVVRAATEILLGDHYLPWVRGEHNKKFTGADKK